MVCNVTESPESPALGCITGAGGFFRCIPDLGVLPSNTPSGTPVGGGLNPNAGPPGDDSRADIPPQVLLDVGTGQRSCTRAEAIGNPIFAGTGNKYQEDLDYSTPSGLRFTRYYNSSLPGWTHSYGMRVLTRDNRAVALRPTGQAYGFTGTGPGEWTGDPATRGQLIRLQANEPSGSTWKYLVQDGTAEYYDAEGRIMRIVRLGGQTFTAHHEQGLLRIVSDPFGRRLLFEYDGDNRLQRLSTPEDMSIEYIYDHKGRLTTVSYPEWGHRHYRYESAQYPLALTFASDFYGFTRWSYDAQGRAVLSEQAGGVQRHQLAFEADGSVQVVDSLGTSRVQRYGAAGARRVFAGQSQSCAHCVGDAADQIVDGISGLVLESRDHLGVSTTFSYEPRNLPTSITRAQGRPEQRQVQVEWHPTLRLPVRVIESGRTTEFGYDSLGNRVSKTATDVRTGQRRTWRWTYNPLGLADSMTDPRSGVWRYGHDPQGNRVSVIDPAGQETRYTFDAAGKVLTEQSPGRAMRAYAWDARHRLTSASEGDETTHYAYAGDGLLYSVTRPDGYQISYEYDNARRLTSMIDNLGNSIQYTLDAAGNRVREEARDEFGQLSRVTGRVIDGFGRVAALQGAQGQTTSFAYDANGEPISTTSPLNETTRRTLDGLRRVTATTLQDNATSGHVWNSLDQLTQLTDPKGVATLYVHDAFGEIANETSPDINTVVHRRDAAGNLMETTDAKGQVTTIDRDLLGRAREIRRADGEIAFHQYNTAGDVVRTDDRSGSVSFTYDDHGRVVSKTQTVNDNPANPSRHTLAYGYERGRLTSVDYPSGLRARYLRYAGRIVVLDVQLPGLFLEDPVPLMFDLRYTALGQPRSWQWSNGEEASRSFDLDGRMTRNEFAEYTHDAAGRITGISQKLWVRSTDSKPESFSQATLSWLAGYDRRDRLIRFERSGAGTQYTYDPNGNRLTATESVSSDVDLEGEFDKGDLGRTTRRVFDIEAASNRLVGMTQTTELVRVGKAPSNAGATVTFSIDANGSMTGDGLRSFEYDAANRLEKVRTPQHNGSAAIRYLHNTAGQRVFRSEPAADDATPDPEVLGEGFVAWLKRRFGWLFTAAKAPNGSLGVVYLHGDGEIPPWALLGEYDNGTAKGRGSTEYIWLPLEDGSAIPVGMFRGGKLYAVHTDHLGTPRVVKDDQRRPVWQWPYSAFGDNKPTGPLIEARKPPTQLSATKPIEFGLRFPGQYEDADAGLNYNLFRWYHSKGGRFTQADPVGARGGLNRFAYVEGNPLSYIDPKGLSPADIQKILETVNSTVSSMTSQGARNSNPYFNNVSSTLNLVSGGRLGSPYLGCGDQESVVRDQLEKRQYDDQWTFTQQSNGIHKWGEARSSNPADPVVTYDPWRGTTKLGR